MSGIKAEYISHMGDDLMVVNAARVSFDKESEWDAKLEGVDEMSTPIYCRTSGQRVGLCICYRCQPSASK